MTRSSGCRCPKPSAKCSGFWLKDQPHGEYLFARALGQKPVSAQAARADRRAMLKQAGIDKKISLHNLRYTYAAHRLDAGAERVDLQALLGHSTINTTQIDTKRGAGADGAGGGEVVKHPAAFPPCVADPPPRSAAADDTAAAFM